MQNPGHPEEAGAKRSATEGSLSRQASKSLGWTAILRRFAPQDDAPAVVRLLWMTVVYVSPLAAQRTAPPVPIRPLGAVVATSAVSFMQIQHLRALSDGRVLINDPGKRQVILLDTSLANPKIVVDSAGGATMYGQSAGALIPFAGDSTLFVDRNASALLVIDAKGDVARVMSVPPGNASQYLTNPTAFGYPGYSPTLGIVYRLPMPRPQIVRPAQGEPEITKKFDDSALVMTMNIKRRTVDTLARVATGSVLTMKLSANNTNTNTQTPIFPIFDDWTVTPDGAVAILRGREYRIDFYNGDGSRTPGPRLPYAWKQVDDDERTRLTDSINTQRRKQFDDMIEDMKKQAMNPDQKIGPGNEKIIIVDGMPIRTYSGERMPPPTPPAPVLATDMPDYLPAVEKNSASFRADADNHLWIRPKPLATTPKSAGPVYDVTDRTGALIDRVQLPAGRTLAGFGPGGIVYVVTRDGGATRIEKRRFK
jgi:hypothetical protein